MTRATFLKFAAGVLLFGTWLGLVLARLAPAPALVDAIGYALVGLGIYHAAAADGQIATKFVAGLLLFGAWLALVAVKLVPAAGLIDAIAYTLMGLGIYQAKNTSTLPQILTGLLGAAAAGNAPAATVDEAMPAAMQQDPTPAAKPTPPAEPVTPAPAAPMAPAPIVAQPPQAVQ